MILTGLLPVDQAGLYALLGYGVVFFGIILLMVVVMIVGKCFEASAKKQVKDEASAPVEEVPAPAAPGSAGQLKLHNVEPRTAAILMAITADKLGKHVNELRFISIKEVTE